MSPIRRLALWLLRAVARRAPSASRDWASAMLRELDFVESDWAALFWALGCTFAIFKHFVPRRLKARFGRESGSEEASTMKEIAKKAASIATGAGVGAALVLIAFGIVYLLFYLFPAWDLGPFPWWVAVVVIPEIIFIVSVVALWRKRRYMAVGILLLAITLATHFIVHVATHASGQ